MQDLAQKIIDAGNDWADKDAAASALEETRRSVKAKIANDCLAESSSVAKAELIAEASPLYSQHIASMVEARRIANRAKVYYDGMKINYEMMRSLEATRREEMKLK